MNVAFKRADQTKCYAATSLSYCDCRISAQIAIALRTSYGIGYLRNVMIYFDILVDKNTSITDIADTSVRLIVTELILINISTYFC